MLAPLELGSCSGTTQRLRPWRVLRVCRVFNPPGSTGGQFCVSGMEGWYAVCCVLCTPHYTPEPGMGPSYFGPLACAARSVRVVCVFTVLRNGDGSV